MINISRINWQNIRVTPNISTSASASRPSRRNPMTSFIHVEKPATHPGVVRAEAALEQVRAARRGFDGARGLAALLLAAIVSSLLVVADRLVSITQEGGLMVAWLVLWAVAFVGLAF